MNYRKSPHSTPGKLSDFEATIWVKIIIFTGRIKEFITSSKGYVRWEFIKKLYYAPRHIKNYIAA